MEDSKKVVEGTTCFAEHAKYKVPCSRTMCRNWINSSDNINCALIAAQGNPMTLAEVGSIFGLTRMRICQIEKTIGKKVLQVIQPE